MAGYAPLRREVVRDLFAKLRPDTARDALALLAWLTVEASWRFGGRLEKTDADIGKALGLTERRARLLRRHLVDAGAVRVARAGRGGGFKGGAVSQALILTAFERSENEVAVEPPAAPPVQAEAGQSWSGSMNEGAGDGVSRGDSRGGSLPKKERKKEEENLLFEVPTCTERGCKEPAAEGGTCFFCSRIWAPWERARKARKAGGCGKAQALKSWRAALRRAGSPPAHVIAEAVAAAVAVHLTHRESSAWMANPPHLTTWLNGSRWNDPPPTSSPRGRQRNTAPEGARDTSTDQKLDQLRRKIAADTEVI